MKYSNSSEEYKSHISIQKTLALLFSVQGVPSLEGLFVLELGASVCLPQGAEATRRLLPRLGSSVIAAQVLINLVLQKKLGGTHTYL